ncbi:dihydroflavonol-4-reductase [Colletotrichum simmondsii]|uniref:Dihydroflavonol-4-reductase n=1 Tax=Colletotrichum simmondsii TaxID=703756 RepID=A0A135S9Q9_9PEZI|nr:dihydroflavonol-4-reductase [Colletotrichum simmondsii]
MGSFVSMLDMSKGLSPGHTYDETDWDPITAEEALANPASGYAALAHVRAMEEPEAGNERFFVANGHYSNRDIIGITCKGSAKYRHSLPSEHLPGGELPEDVFFINAQCSVNILGMKYGTLEDCIADTVESSAAVESQNN